VKFLQDMVYIVVGLIVLQTRRRPLKDVSARLDEGEFKVIDDAVDTFLKADRDGDRRFHEGLPLGVPDRDIVCEGDTVRGVGDEPSNNTVNTGFTKANFKVGQNVLVWWWGLWWHATVFEKPVRAPTLTIRWDWSGNKQRAYLPRLIRPYP